MDGTTIYGIFCTFGQLADSGLLTAPSLPSDEPRFLMLETIRSFGLDRLIAATELEEAGWQHASYFEGIAWQARLAVRGIDQPVWIGQIDRERDNLRAARDWLTAHGRADHALKMAVGLYWYWYIRGHLNEADLWLTGALAVAERRPDATRAEALLYFAHLHWRLGEYETALTALAEQQDLARSLGDQTLTALGLGVAGVIATSQADYDRSDALFSEGIALFPKDGED